MIILEVFLYSLQRPTDTRMKFTYPGLTDQEVEASRAQHGSNAVASQDIETFWDKLLNNLKDPIIILIATWPEHSNKQSFQRLLEEASLIRVKVFRNGHPAEIVLSHTGLWRVSSPNGFD